MSLSFVGKRTYYLGHQSAFPDSTTACSCTMDHPQADITHRQDHGNANVWPNAMEYDNSHVHLASTAAESYQLGAPHDLDSVVGPAALSTARGASAALHAAAGLQPTLQYSLRQPRKDVLN